MRVVHQSLGKRRDLDRPLEHRRSGFGFSALCECMGKKACSPVVVVSPILRHNVLKIGYRRGIVFELKFAKSASVKGVGQIGAGGDSVVVAIASASVLAVFEIEVRELLVIPRRRIVEN